MGVLVIGEFVVTTIEVGESVGVRLGESKLSVHCPFSIV